MAIAHTDPWHPLACDGSDWFWPLRALGLTFRAHHRFPSPEELSAGFAERMSQLGLGSAPFASLRFVAAEKKKRRRAKTSIRVSDLYEGQVIEMHRVPTRENDWHDFFNAMAFTTFPRAKWALHARQHSILRQRIGDGARRLPGSRTREQDALSLFDEGGVVVALTALAHAKLAREAGDDLQSSISSLIESRQAIVIPFGHALYEHLIAGLPCPLAAHHLMPLLPHPESAPALASFLEKIDRLLAADLADSNQFRAPHTSRALSLTGLAQTQAEMECILQGPCSPC